MSNITSALKNLDLTPKQIEVYLTLLQYGQCTASTLANKLRLNRTTLYSILKVMQGRGLVSNYKKQSATFFSAISPDLILEKARRKLNEAQTYFNQIETIIPELKSIEQLYANSPKLKLYEGAAGIKTLYSETLKSKKIHAFIPLHTLPKELHTFLTKEYIELRKEYKSFTYAMVENSPFAKKYQKKDKDSHRETKIIPYKNVPLDAEISLYGKNKIAIISFTDELVGFSIENQAMYNTLLSVFKIVWNTVK